jgi:phage terminase large subunit
MPEAKLIRYGLDFGFNDPTALVAIYETEDGEFIVKQLIYENELNSDQYPAALEAAKVDPNILIVADSARPEIISTIRQAGFRIVPADKNAGSVMRGIDRVQQKHIIYDGKDLEREYLSYAWRKTRTGKSLEEPQDGNDHLMDALRYAIDDLEKPRFDF